MVDSVRALLSGIIDYAGLFPPASLGMTQAVRNYERYRSGPHAWMLGRFVVPLGRLAEFGAAASERWPVSVLAGSDPASAIAAGVDTIELKADCPDQIVSFAIPDNVSAYVEIPPDDEFIEAVAQARLRAKIRTGGITPSAFPASADIARFIRGCDDARIAFKATAGLHHAVRGEHKLTYEPDSASCVMHGFLNVFLAAAFRCAGVTDSELIAILEAPAAAFRFNRNGVTWRDRWISTEQIAAARSRLAIAFGSCSFDEPVHDLQELRLL